MAQTLRLFQLAPTSTGVLILVVGWLLSIIYHPYATSLRHVPGPCPGVKGRRIHYIHSLHQRYGFVVRSAPVELAISDFESFREIHSIKSGYLKSPWYLKFIRGDIPGVFALTDPHEHAKRRRLLARGLTKSYLKQNCEHIVREKAELAVQKIKRDAKRGTADVMKGWTFYATDVLDRLAFGESFHMLEHEEKKSYIRALETTMFVRGLGAELPLLHDIYRYTPLPVTRRMFRPQEILLEYGTRAVSKARSQQHIKTIFSAVLAEADKEDGSFTNKQLNREAQGMITGGSGTTAAKLTYLTWAFLKHPEVQKQLEDEVATLTPDFKDVELERLPLLNAVIEETLRLYGGVPGSLPRVTPPSGATLSGYFIPGGTTVCTQAYTIHRNSSIFGDPDTYAVSYQSL